MALDLVGQHGLTHQSEVFLVVDAEIQSVIAAAGLGDRLANPTT